MDRRCWGEGYSGILMATIAFGFMVPLGTVLAAICLAIGLAIALASVCFALGLVVLVVFVVYSLWYMVTSILTS